MTATDDITDPALFADMGRLYRCYGQLRHAAPAHYVEPAGYRPFWIVTRHADIKAISLDAKAFLNGPRTQLFPIEAERFIAAARPDGVGVIRSIVHMDEPDHRQYRAITQSWFGAANLKRNVLPRIDELARTHVDRMIEMGDCDFVKDVALWYPLCVIMLLLGVPEADLALMLKLTQEVFGPLDPEVAREAKPTDLAVVIDDFFSYFRALAEDRRKSPRDDLATVIAQATLGGEAIPDFEAMSYFTVIATAGHDTTSSSIAGGLLALIENPQEFERLRRQPELMGTAVDEMIRWETPVRHFMRTAAADYDLHGTIIHKGEDVMLAYPAANRDPAVFGDPDRFRIDRSPNPHLAFGFGPHHCVGNVLAKMEMKMLFDEIVKRTGSITLRGAPSWTQANFIGGLKSLPVSVLPL